ncbi:MAG: hypothetical protein HOP11_00385 [Saprospiraceae bacterium]|nr:hypothetical protein [Saprospiraceae bacterium]
MHKYITCFSLISFLTPSEAKSQNATWAADVASIVYNKCTSCHRTGGIAPFSIENYQEAVSSSSSIKRVVEKGTMPPWPPDQTYSRFAHERSLSADQKNKILNWINSNTPRGDISVEPPLPNFPNNGDLSGTPDLSKMTPLFTINASSDIYQCFVLKNTESIDKFISAMEVIPGNRSAVHHVLVYYDKTGQAQKLDDASPEPGYKSFGGIGVNSAELIGAWVPGSTPQVYPKGMGVKLPAGGDIVMQIHYPSSSDGQKDQTILKLFYSKESKVRQVFIVPILDHLGTLTNGPLVIPANTIKTFNSQFNTNLLKATVLSVAPHMHLIGKSIEVYATNPNNTKTNLIRINNWDFHWQGYYSFPKPIILNPGTKVVANATYDNTSNNVNNPNSPPKIITLGEKTTDEMMLVYFSFLLYENGDENIIIDSSFINNVNEAGITESRDWNINKQSNNSYLVTIDPEMIGGFLHIYNESGHVLQHQKISTINTDIYIPNRSGGILYCQFIKDNKKSLKRLFTN